MEAILSINSLKNKQISAIMLAFVLGLIGGVALIYLSKLPTMYVILFELFFLLGCFLLYFQKIKIFLLATLIVTLTINVDKTFYFSPGHTGGVSGFVISVWFLMLIGLYVIWFIESFRGIAPKVNFFHHLTIPLLILLAIAMFSTVKATEVKFSVFQIFQMIKVFLLFFYIANNIRTSRDYKLILIVLFITFFAELILAYYQHVVNDYVDLSIFSDSKPHRARQIGDQEMMAVHGTTSGSHRFASYLIMILPLLLTGILSRTKLWLKTIYGGLFAGGIIILIYTFSRGGWVGFTIGISILLILYLYKSKNQLTGYVQLFLLIVTVSFIIFYFKETIFLRITGEDYGSAYSRIPMMQIAFDIIKNNPILGVGLNNYTIIMSTYDFTGITYTYFQPVHNVFLQLAAEIGIGGLLVFVVFLFMLYRTAILTLRQSDAYHREQLIGLICGITALLVHQTMNNGTIDAETFELFWLFAGLIAAFSGKSIESNA